MNYLSPKFRAILLGVAVVGGYFGHLLLPDRILMVRDLPFLHLPLRDAFVALATAGGFGLPDWNPTIHGGQPVLSNPHYAAWYPATWLGFLMPVGAAIHASVLAHAALAFAGAWRLLRQLGASRWGAAYAAVAFAGGGFYVALTNTLLVFTGLAWTPWVLAGAEAWLRGSHNLTSLAAVAVPLALQILNGDPAAVAVSVVFMGFQAVAAARETGYARSAGRLALAGLLALALGAVQFAPTWMRLMDSKRGAGLSFADATAWSTRPARLVEAVFPTFHGEAARDEENLYFGWTLHDRQYPLLISIYPGLLTVLLGLTGFFARGLPQRNVWIGAALVGLFLGLGRHNPLFAGAHAAVPFLGMVRYPEKFLLLPLLALVVSAALFFDRTARPASDGELSPAGRRAALLPVGFAAVVGIGAAARALWILLAPHAVTDWMERACGFALSTAVKAAGLDYLRQQAVIALVITTTAALVLLLLSMRAGLGQPSRKAMVLALLFGALDNWTYSHRFNPTLPRDEFVAPALAARLPPFRSGPSSERIFHDLGFYRGPSAGLPVGRRGFHQITVRVDRLEPYSATLWGHGYALNEDYDLMLTVWGRHALRLLHEDYAHEARRDRLLGAWNVGHRVHVRSPAEMRPELEAWRSLPEAVRRESAPDPARLVRNPDVLPRIRLAARAVSHPSVEAAVAAARRDGFDATAREHLVMLDTPDEPATLLAPLEGEIVSAVERTDERVIRLRAAGAGVATVIVAETFDSGWSAHDQAGNPMPIVATAIGQMAIRAAVPAAGEITLRLVHRDPWVRIGGALSLVTGLALGLVFLRRRRAPLAHV